MICWSRLLLISLIATFARISFSQGYTIGDYSGYYSYNGNMGPGSNKSDQADSSCDNSVSNANRAFAQLLTDLKGKAYQWSINSDIDAVGEVSYFLKSNCKTQNLDLINVGKTGVNKTEDLACERLLIVLTKVLEQKEATSFRGGFEGGIKLVGKARRLAKFLSDECKPLLVIREADANDTQTTEFSSPTSPPVASNFGPPGMIPQVLAVNQTAPVTPVNLSNDTTTQLNLDLDLEKSGVVLLSATNLRVTMKKSDNGNGNLFVIDAKKFL